MSGVASTHVHGDNLQPFAHMHDHRKVHLHQNYRKDRFTKGRQRRNLKT